ncbi:MAG: hypothetical protein LBP33_00345 [Candidatus Adiutrix sp.]|nr:hypothetical protein [Candidatus Adiutrix sp.]
MPLKEKDIKGDKIWRSAALIVLCGLVYFFSYDHGRQSLKPPLERLEAYRQEASLELENQRREILRLQAALAECDVQNDLAPSLDRIPLKVNQSRILFGGRLVLTLLKVDSAESRAAVQLNFIEEERLVTRELAAGGSLRFALDGRDWAVVISALSLSTANLNLVELRDRE